MRRRIVCCDGSWQDLDNQHRTNIVMMTIFRWGWGIALAVSFVIVLAIFAWEGFITKGISCLLITSILNVSIALGGAGIKTEFDILSYALSIAATGAIVVALPPAVTATSLAGGLTSALLVSGHFGGLTDVWQASVLMAIVFTLFIVFWRVQKGCAGYAGLRSFAHGLRCIGATRFCYADLRGAIFNDARLARVSFAASRRVAPRLEAWNIDHGTNLHGIDCAYVYLLEPFDAHGQRREDQHRERLPHDPAKSFEAGDFEIYFKQLIEEVKLLIKNGVDARAFQQAFQEVMRQHPQITQESVTGLKRSGNDLLVTLQAPASVDKGAVEQTFFA